MPMQKALEGALNRAADEGDTWTAGWNVFWRALQEEDATIGGAIHKALFRVCGEDKERLTEAKNLFFTLYRGNREKSNDS